MRPGMILSFLIPALGGCTKSAAQMFEIEDSTGDLEYWQDAGMIVCEAFASDGNIIIVGEAEDYNADGHEAYVIGFTLPWPAGYDTKTDSDISVSVTTVADAANGGLGSATYSLGEVLPEAVGDEPAETRWHELTIDHLEFPAQSLKGMYGPMPLDASTLDDGFFYCEDMDASLHNQLGKYG